MANKHSDCRNFAPVDVAKGICHRTKDLVITDSLPCEDFLSLPKCRNCRLYEPDPTEPVMGLCQAEKDRPWTYAELVAITCQWYAESE
jgi:4-hydroxyphenylacetate decarboxylase small subunit